MNRALIPLTALALSLAAAPVLAAGVIPPATKYSSSLTEPTPASGSDFHITKSSSIQVSVASNSVIVKLKLAGIVQSGVLVNQTGNVLQVDLRYGGILHTIPFNFDLVKGKTVTASSKFTTALTSLPGGGVAPGSPIEVRIARCIQGGAGAGAGSSFCTPGLTAK